MTPVKTPVLLPRRVLGLDAGAFEGLPGGFQQQPLLGVHGQRLAGGDAEERRVEPVGVVQEAALVGIAGAGVVGVGVVQGVQVPAAVVGEAADASRPSATSCHRSSGEAAPPG